MIRLLCVSFLTGAGVGFGFAIPFIIAIWIIIKMIK